MSCDVCGAPEASVGYAEIVDGVLSTWRLCERCALARGIGTNTATFGGPASSILMGLLEADEGASSDGSLECPGCGHTFDGFRRTGRLGCAECYTAFADELRPLIRRIHGTTEHIGCTPGDSEGSQNRTREIRKLRSELRAAVRKEDFERAAELRDSIAGLETEMSERQRPPDIREDGSSGEGQRGVDTRDNDA
jgi:protein arginine kinase activator